MYAVIMMLADDIFCIVPINDIINDIYSDCNSR